jgi:hypothetical protein
MPDENVKIQRWREGTKKGEFLGIASQGYLADIAIK